MWRGGRRELGPRLGRSSAGAAGQLLRVTPAGTAWGSAAEAAHVTSLFPPAARGPRLAGSSRVSTRAQPRHGVSAGARRLCRGSASLPGLGLAAGLVSCARRVRGCCRKAGCTSGVQGPGPSPSRCCGGPARWPAGTPGCVCRRRGSTEGSDCAARGARNWAAEEQAARGPSLLNLCEENHISSIEHLVF